jgi:hypothetical protein
MARFYSPQSALITEKENPSLWQFLRHSGTGLSIGALAGAKMKWTTSCRADETPQKVRFPVINCHAYAGNATAMTDPWTCIDDPEAILRDIGFLDPISGGRP